MRVSIITKEWPPQIYGGAGVHVDQLVDQLTRLVDVDVHCFGEPRRDAQAHATPARLAEANAALQTIGTDVDIAASLAAPDVVHSHTWYANLAGTLGALMSGVPHVITAHSLEPLRPWKAEQLGGGYRVSSWAERTAYLGADAIIAVSHGMRADVLASYPQVDPERVHVVHNGIDTTVHHPTPTGEVLARYDIDPHRPIVLFVGRITRQKGLPHLLRAARGLPDGAQLVLAASSPDTPELGAEVEAGIARLRQERGSDIHWIAEHVHKDTLIALYSAATVFACPSVYEPLGIVNLEAMACQTAVVGSRVGGIPEVVADGETGLLVDYDQSRPDAFEADLTTAMSQLLNDPDRAAAMGIAGRQRAATHFGWDAIAAQTVDVYRWAQEHQRDSQAGVATP